MHRLQQDVTPGSSQVKGFRTSGSRHVRGVQTVLDLFPGFFRC